MRADTTIEAANAQRAAIAAKSPGERAEMALAMSEFIRRTTLEGIRRRDPDLSDEQLMDRLLERMHGPSLAAAVAAHRG